MKYESDTLIKVYEGTPTFEEGLLGKIIDRDPNDGSYAVASLEAIVKEDGDVYVLLRNHVKWVKEDDMRPITFDRPSIPKKINIGSIIILLLGIVIGLATRL